MFMDAVCLLGSVSDYRLSVVHKEPGLIGVRVQGRRHQLVRSQRQGSRRCISTS